MVYLIEIIQASVIIYFSLVCIYKSTTKKFRILYPIIALILCIILYLTKFNNILNLVSALLIYFIVPIFLSEYSFKKTAYLCLIDIGVLSFFDSFWDLITNILFNNLNSTITYFYINLIITVICILLMTIAPIRLNIQRFFSSTKLIKTVVLIDIWVLFILSTVTIYIANMNIKFAFLLTALILFLLGISVAIAVYIAANNKKKLFYENAAATLEKNMKNQIKHYEEKQKMYENLRKFKHDSENLKTGLLILLENNQIEEAKAYLSGFSQQLESKYITVSSGSPVLDALIADKQAEAKKHNITIAFNGLLPYDAIDTLDLCVVFGNALDNAIEACCKLSEAEKKTITISVKQNKNLLIINISNPVAKKITVKHNSVRTTKNDSANHGIGIYSIKNTVKKYDGFCELKCHEKVFTLEMGFFITDSISKAI